MDKKEQKQLELSLNNYIKEHKSTEECSGFIDGFKASLSLPKEVDTKKEVYLDANTLKLMLRIKELEKEKNGHFNHLMEYMQLVEEFVGFAGPSERVREELSKKIKSIQGLKEVDLEGLRKEFENFYFEGEEMDIVENITFGHKDIFNFFLPHLQKPVESDAVEFAEWSAINLWLYKGHDDLWINYGGVDLRKFKSKELYEQFKQLKK